MSNSSVPQLPSSVLVVDDTVTMLDMYAHLLRHQGYTVQTAVDGRSALACLETFNPDLIVLDHMMPGMNGLEVLERIRRNPRTSATPVVMLTASGDNDEVISSAFALGATDYLQKPINRMIFLSRVAALVLQHRQTAVLSSARDMEGDNERVRAELERAREVQHSQLPPTPSTRDGWRVTAALRSCQEVGGDQFDIIDDKHGRRTIAVVDVSGHGLASAMIGASVRGMLRLLLPARTLDAALQEVNAQLGESAGDHYACVALIQFDGDQIHVINAGLPPVLLIGTDEVTEVAGGGVPPGLLPRATYTVVSKPAPLVRRIVSVTDGLTEPFGAADDTRGSLEALGLPTTGISVPQLELEQRVASVFEKRSGVQPDDATIIIAERVSTIP